VSALAICHGLLISSVVLSVGCTHATPETAWKEYRAQRYDDAMAAWQKVLEDNPLSGEAYYGLGLSQLRKGAQGSAERSLERATQLDLENSQLLDAYIQLSKLYLVRHPEERPYMDAVGSMADQILQRDAGNVQALLNWGEVARWRARDAFQRNENDMGVEWAAKSIASFKEAAAKQPGDPKVWRNLAVSQELAGDFPAAAESWQRVLVVDINNLEGYRHVLRINCRLGNGAAAERVVSQVVDQKPISADLVLGLAEEALDLNRLDLYDRAAASFHAAINSSATHYATAARLEFRRGSHEKALSLYRLAERADGKHWEQYRLAAARILIETGQMAEANAKISELRKRAPGDPKVGVLSAALLRSEGKLREAEEVLRPILAQHPDDAEASTEQARIYNQQGNYPMAIAVLKACQRTSPDYLPASLELAEVYLRSGLNEAAAIAASAALTKDPVNSRAQRLLAAARPSRP
jgi:cellulose synthase operon protein C